MADNEKEILKDAELEEIVGGTGAETIALMYRLQKDGLASFKTPLVAGNEEAAAAELKAYLTSLKDSQGGRLFVEPQIYADGRANDYFPVIGYSKQPGETDADTVIRVIKNYGVR